MVKSLSAIITSPGDNFGIKSSFCTICLSDAFSPHNLDTNDTIPFGVTPMSILKVLWCLYSDHVNHWDTREDSLSRKTQQLYEYLNDY